MAHVAPAETASWPNPSLKLPGTVPWRYSVIARSSMPRIISIARRRPARSSVVRCSVTSGGNASDRAVSVAIGRYLSLRVSKCAARDRQVARRSGRRDLRRRRGSTVASRLLDGGLRLTSSMVEFVRWRRLRWRLRGAWQWPAFVVLTVVDVVLVARLPFQGGGADAMGAFLVAGFFNLIAVAVLAPVFGWLLRKRRRDLPFMIARDYAGAVLLVAITGGILVGG